MESRYLWSAITIAAFVYTGCSASHDARPAVDPTADQEAEGAQPPACQDGSQRTWDLGTGRLEDIQVKAPDFYRFAPEAEVSNALRSKRLARAKLPEHVALKARAVGRERLAEFVRSESAPSRIVVFTAWRSEDPERVLMILPEQCPQIEVQEQCVEGRIVASVRSTQTVTCFAGRSGRFGVSGPDFRSGTTIAPGDALWLEVRAGGIQVSLDSGKETFLSAVLQPDVFESVTPDLLYAILEFAGELSAIKQIGHVDQRWLTASFEDRLVALRVEKVRRSIANGDQASIALLAVVPDERLPGTARVFRTLQPELQAAFGEIAGSGRSVHDFDRGLRYLDLLADPNDAETLAFQARFGAGFAKGEIAGGPVGIEVAEDEFVRRWPDSSGAKKITARRTKEAAATKAVADAERRKAEAEAQRARDAENAQCFARCDHKCMSWQYADKALCKKGCRNYECENNFCVGACQADCSTVSKAGQPGCVQACIKGRCGE